MEWQVILMFCIGSYIENIYYEIIDDVQMALHADAFVSIGFFGGNNIVLYIAEEFFRMKFRFLAIEVAGFICHNCIVCNGLSCVSIILRKITAAIFLFDVYKPCRAVV